MFSLWGLLSGAFHQNPVGKTKIRAGFLNAHCDILCKDENKTKLKQCFLRLVWFGLLVLGFLPTVRWFLGYFAPLSEELVVGGLAKSKRAVAVGVWLEEGGQLRTDKMRTQNASLWGAFFFYFWMSAFQNSLKVWKQKDFDISCLVFGSAG